MLQPVSAVLDLPYILPLPQMKRGWAMGDNLRPGRPDDLAADIEHALRFQARSYFTFKKHDDPAPGTIAHQIVEHLRVANWRFFRGPGALLHGTTHGPRSKNKP